MQEKLSVRLKVFAALAVGNRPPNQIGYVGIIKFRLNHGFSHCFYVLVLLCIRMSSPNELEYQSSMACLF
jgi:hypothetical protein